MTTWVVAYRARLLTFDAKESTLARAMTTSLKLLSAAEKLDWLRLIRSENVGPITFYRLLEHFGSAGAALKNLPDIARRRGTGTAHHRLWQGGGRARGGGGVGDVAGAGIGAGGPRVDP